MLSVTDAEAIIFDLVQPLRETETVALEDALGRVLATPVRSGLDFPYWDNSAMDGYAVRFEDVRSVPVTLEIIEEIPAGVAPQKTLQVGQAARIFTGAVMPQGADAVVMQENTRREGNQVIIQESSASGAFVRHQGAFYQANTPLLEAGITINAPELAVLATAQCTQLQVYRRPRVAIFSTGDELIPPSGVLQPGQIVDSNQYALAALVWGLGAIPVPLGIIPDCRGELKGAIAQSLKSADIVLSTGGVSVGDYDYIEELLAELGGKIHVRSVAVKPGKPLTVAEFPNCLYFGIPGNPVSALVSGWRFVLPALRKLAGLKDWRPELIYVPTKHQLTAGGKRETYLWGQLNGIEGEYQFSVAGGSHSSGNLINLAGTNALAIVPVGVAEIPAGEKVRVLRV
ncbi:molybdopterin molybdotransferase MoeA [Spirulina sp. CS-785/01]|uniref:molybdopterin molybdotransferase MoeA n=1 Tax=Spirulina sp. CS-785/01 TaxID=3021716 RepID=UPI00232C2784|nr:gephyrin-like molybdotransferase Glp [Spirulina sp. CS-785/01]MDB9313291.1 molybdopterin molybdotransferase MoeA [Spirulina sp. CS-785/01]